MQEDIKGINYDYKFPKIIHLDINSEINNKKGKKFQKFLNKENLILINSKKNT